MQNILKLYPKAPEASFNQTKTEISWSTLDPGEALLDPEIYVLKRQVIYLSHT